MKFVTKQAMTHDEVVARQLEQRALLVRQLDNEKSKLAPANDRLKLAQAAMTTAAPRVGVLRKFADAGDAAAAGHLQIERTKLAASQQERDSWGNAIGEIQRRIAAYEAEIVEHDATQITPLAKGELDAVLGDIADEHRGERIAADERAAGFARMTAAHIADRSWWPAWATRGNK